jgi:hypothetical protein
VSKKEATYRHQDWVKKMARLVYEGYSYNDAFLLTIDQYDPQNHDPISDSDWQIIYGKAADLVAQVIVKKEKEGSLHRVEKKLKVSTLKNKEMVQRMEATLYKNPYAKPLSLFERMQMSYRSYQYEHKNPTKVLQLMVRRFNIDLTDPNDRPLKILKRLQKENP